MMSSAVAFQMKGLGVVVPLLGPDRDRLGEIGDGCEHAVA